MSIKSRIAHLRERVAVYKLWLVHSLLGPDALTFKELETLKASGLPLERPTKLADLGFTLGRLKSFLSEKEYKDLNIAQVQEYLDETSLDGYSEQVLEQVRSKAAEYVKGLSDDITNGLFTKLQQELDNTLTEAAIKDILKDETQLALMQDKTVQEFTSSIVGALKTEYSPRWKRVAATELHSAKIRAQVTVLANKEGIYAASEGVDSLVSVVPSNTCCEDCAALYLDGEGNPKVFTLRILMQNGSNGEPGVSHKRDGGLHTGWKPTLPPLHPNCSCQLTYLPPGISWSGGKLIVKSLEIYQDGIAKARNVAMEQTEPSSLPGLPAPGNEAGPGRPKNAGPQIEYQYEPVNQGKPDGPGWEMSDSGKSYKRPKGMSQAANDAELTDEDKQLLVQASLKEARGWNREPHTHAKVLDHMADGKISTIENFTDDSHANKAFKVSIEGNGSGLMKPSAPLRGDNVATEGLGYMPQRTEPAREKGAYHLAMAMGLTDHVPPTATRTHQGEQVSMQHWKEDFMQAGQWLRDKNVDTEGDAIGTTLKMLSEEKRTKMEEKLCEIASMDLVMNNTDRHAGNILFNKDMTDATGIDHGVAFCNGMNGIKNAILQHYHRSRRQFKIPTKVKEKLDNMTLGDYKRALKETGLADWEIGQTFLRSRYISWLQDSEGEIDYNKFIPTLSTLSNSVEIPRMRSVPSKEDLHVYDTRKKLGELPNQLFESWAKNFMQEAKADPSHKDNAIIGELEKTGVFMGAGFAKDPAKYRMLGKHREYEESVLPRNPPKVLYSPRIKSDAVVAPTMKERRQRKPNEVLAQDPTIKDRRVKPFKG